MAEIKAMASSKGKEVGDGKLVSSDQACLDDVPEVTPKKESFQLNDLLMVLKPCKSSKDTPVSPIKEELKSDSFKSGDSRNPWQEIVEYRRHLSGLLHKRNYDDGERLSPEDEKAVRDVLKYHKKFEEKTGVGIDYIKIQKIYNERLTRCFWVVRVDGTEVDFSYHKCLKEKAAEECPDMLDQYDSMFKSSATKRATVFDVKTRHKVSIFQLASETKALGCYTSF